MQVEMGRSRNIPRFACPRCENPMIDLNALQLPDLFPALVSDRDLARLLNAARDEDLGSGGDVTSESIIDPCRSGRAILAARGEGVVCGQHLPAPLVAAFNAEVRTEWRILDGGWCARGAIVAVLQGRMRDLLAIERTLLNLVTHLSGIATLTYRFVRAIAGTKAVICDTRKTTPGLRGLEKYAVRCGGGALHRIGLYDAALYKDNHLAALDPAHLAGTLAAAIRKVRAGDRVRFVEVEVDSIAMLEQVLSIEAGLIDMVLLDNMPVAVLEEAVAVRNRRAPQVQLEASGGVTLENVRAIAETGVDRISVGSLTHSAPALDLGLDLEAGRPDGE